MAMRCGGITPFDNRSSHDLWQKERPRQQDNDQYKKTQINHVAAQ